MASRTWVTGEQSSPGISKVVKCQNIFKTFQNIFTSWSHLVVAPGWLDWNLLTGVVLQQLGHSLALSDAVQEQEIPGRNKMTHGTPLSPPILPPGVLCEVFAGLHPLSQKCEVCQELFGSRLAAL